MVMDPFLTFILVLLIGTAAGVIGQRGVRTSWLSRRLERDSIFLNRGILESERF